MTRSPQPTHDEPLRLQSLRRLGLVDTPLDERFERITRLAKRLLGAEIASISLLEADRQCFLSVQGLSISETARDISFCGHAIHSPEMMIVPDARLDPRFKDNPLVKGPPRIVFYAGRPIHSPDGAHLIGTLCVIDSHTRPFTMIDRRTLDDLALLVEAEFRVRSVNSAREDLLAGIAPEQRRTLVDPLTRVWNRAGVREIISRQLVETASGGQSIAIVRVGLQNLARVRAVHGPQEADDLLRATARGLLASLRETDSVARVGDDQFLISLAPCESEASAKAILTGAAMRLQDVFIDHGSDDIPLMVRCGVSFIARGRSVEPDSAIEQASCALHEATGPSAPGTGIVSRAA